MPAPDDGDPLSFPRQQARTRRFTLGRPRDVRVVADGRRVLYLRSAGGEDPVNRLWALDVGGGDDPGGDGERAVVDPATLLAAGEEDLPPEERARRERQREQASGIVSYAADRAGRVVAFALAGRLFVADADRAEAAELPVQGPVFDPRPDPTGRRVAFVAGRALWVVDLDGDPGHGGWPSAGEERVLAGEEPPDVSWGAAEFVAAEEMDRTRGFWWSPDGARVAATRVDVGPVVRWHLADPADPAAAPAVVAYPAAGTANADVTLHVLAAERGDPPAPVEVAWDRAAFPYLATVAWDEHGLALVVQSRDQRRVQTLLADPATGATTTLEERRDPAWVHLVPGVPTWLDDGRLVGVDDDAASDTRRVHVDGRPVTPPGLQVRGVVHAGGDRVVFVGSTDPTEQHVFTVTPGSAPEQLTHDPGVHHAAAAGDVVVVSSQAPDGEPTTRVTRGGATVATLDSVAAAPVVHPSPTLFVTGAHELRSALLVPGGDRGDGAGGPWPVLVHPYGGPGAQRVLRARNAFLAPQWFADQGFAVLVTDGRGTPGRGPAWERTVRGDLAGPVLDDQVAALEAVASGDGRLDTSRVAIQGWSFGGYLAALAVLRRPDVFHAAVAGAPVTEWRLYDTHYTERYLGHPDDDPAAYDRSSLLPVAAHLERPLLLVHGLADDNVVAAHTLQLSRALLEAGRSHAVLPLSGVTHMTPQEVVAENLLLLQVDFLHRALGVAPSVTRA